MIFGSIIGSVVGGLFQQSAAKKQRQAAIDDARLALPRLRESAEEAGFNPLTALSNGALSSFQNLPSGVAPLASTEAVMGIAQGVEDRLTGKEAQREEYEEAQHELMKIQLERAKAGGGYLPVGTSIYGGGISGKPGVAAPSKRTYPQLTPQQGETMNTNPWPIAPGEGPGTGVFIDPRRPDAEHGEQRYGDVAQELFGFGNAVSDFQYNNTIQSVRREYGDQAAQDLHQRMTENPRLWLHDELLNLQNKKEIEAVRGSGHVAPEDDGMSALERDDPEGYRIKRDRLDFFRRNGGNVVFQ